MQALPVETARTEALARQTQRKINIVAHAVVLIAKSVRAGRYDLAEEVGVKLLGIIKSWKNVDANKNA